MYDESLIIDIVLTKLLPILIITHPESVVELKLESSPLTDEQETDLYRP